MLAGPRYRTDTPLSADYRNIGGSGITGRQNVRAPWNGIAPSLLYSRGMLARRPRIPVSDRLLMELVRWREECAGHPADSMEADAAARAAGGPLQARIAHRARRLPDCGPLRAGLRRARIVLMAATGALVAAFGIAGILAAGGALGSADPVSLPLALLVVVGPSLATLLLWLALLPMLRGGGATNALSALVARYLDDRATPAGDALRLLLLGRSGRWITASVAHAAWLGYTLGAGAALLVLLSVRSYALSWETTLLDAGTLAAWAHAFSAVPALLGFAGAESLPLRPPMPDGAREAWAAWLLAAVMVYGVLPRALALLVTLALARRALRASSDDLHQPGYARLRSRLLPDHGTARVVDAPPAPETVAAAPAGVALPAGALHALALETECPADPLPPDWIWLGAVDDRDSRERALAELQRDTVRGLAIIVRGAATPDRGNRHAVEALRDAAGAPAVLLLAGPVPPARRADWQRLAEHAGLTLGVWPPAEGGDA